MSLQFIFGNSGSGKSHYLYEEMIRESIAHPDQDYIVLVPEQFTMQTQKEFVTRHPHKGIFNIDVLSFGRLALRVLDETGQQTKQVLDDEGKSLILRKVAGDNKEKLKVLGGNLKKPGYISEVKSVISEFVQYDIHPEEMDRMLELVGEESFLGCKLQDIRTVYEQFFHYLEEKYITKEEILDVLCLAAADSKKLRDCVVVLDGFTGFTPVQNRFLKELMRICKKVCVTVTIDRREDPYRYRGPYELFAVSKQTVTRLVELAGEQRTKLEEPIWLTKGTPWRFRDNDTLAFLEHNLFRYTKHTYDGVWEAGNEVIQIKEAGTPREEVAYVAAQIHRLVRTEKLRYRDIAVIATDLTSYAEDIREVFSQWELPVFMDYKRNVLLNSFVEYVRSLIDLVKEGFTPESVFRFLKTGLTEFTSEEIDRMENYVLALGIRGYKRWQEKWLRKTKEMDEQELERLNHLRVQFVEKVDGFQFIMRQRTKQVRDITTAVYEFLVKEKIAEKIKEQEQYFEENGELALAKEYSQIYRIVMELFDKFVLLLGDEEVSVAEYAQLLDAGLAEARVGVIPPGIDQIVAGDMERTRLNDIQTLFVLGVNDVYLPGKLSSGGLLCEYDREKLKGANVALSPGGKEKAYIQKFYLYLNLTKPSRSLYLSYARTSSAGKSMRPAYLVMDLLRMYPKLSVTEAKKEELESREMTPVTAVEALVEGLQRKEEPLGDSWKELYTWYYNHPLWHDKVQQLVEAAFYQKEDVALKEETARMLYGGRFEGSVTRLERFCSCAFAHFLAYGLRLTERKVYEFKAMDLGNLFHGAMERFSKKVHQSNRRWSELDEEERLELVDACVEESIVDYDNTVLYSNARNEYMIKRLKRLVNRTAWALIEQLKRGDFEPEGYEVVFSGGKIDRVDVCEEDERIYVKVIDYKTGSKAFDIVSLYYGLQLQLTVYLNAAMDMQKKRHPDKDIVPAGVFYYKMKDPVVDRIEEEELTEQERKNKLEESILKELRLDGILNSDEAVLTHLDHTMKSSSLVIPAGRKKDKSLTSASKVLDQDSFLAMLEFTKRKKKAISEEILKGRAQIDPYEMNQVTGCDYCPYKNICGFDLKIPGCAYRTLLRLDKEDVIQKMKESMEWE